MTRAEAFRQSYIGGHAQMVAWQRMERTYLHYAKRAWDRNLQYLETNVWLTAPRVSGGAPVIVPVVWGL
jgi:hypothetical protein